MKIGNWKLEIIFFAAIFFCGVFTLPHSTHAATVTWTGAGADNNWSTSGNWTGGTGVPTSADDVVFSGDTGTYPNADKDSTWDSSGPATVKSVNFQSGYAGNATISKTSVTVAGSWTWAGTGTFDAGTGTITFSANGTFTPGSVTYYNITVQANNNTITTSGTATVANNFSTTQVSGQVVMLSGTWDVSGSLSSAGSVSSTSTTVLAVVGTANQSITGGFYPSITINKSSGTLTLSGTISLRIWTYTAGTVDVGTSTISTPYGQGTWAPGSLALYNVTITSNNNTITLSGDMTVLNNLSLVQSSGSVTLNSSNIIVHGNISTSASINSSSTGGIIVAGTGNQTLSASGSGVIDNITIDKPSGTLTLSGTIPVQGNWTHTKGTIDPGSSTLQFQSASSTFTPGSASYNNITVALNSGLTLTVSGTATILGNLTLNSTSGGQIFNSGTLRVFGNVDSSGSQATTGTGIIEIAGPGTQSLSSTGGGSFSNITINKTGGTLTLGSSVTVRINWIWNTGEFNAGSYTLTLQSSTGGSFTPGTVRYYNLTISDSAGGTRTMTGTATVTNDLNITVTSTAILNNGTINVSGNVTHSGTATLSGTAIIALVGTGNQTLSFSSTGVIANVVVNKSAGVLTLSGTISIRTSWTWTAGTIDAGTSTLNMSILSGGITFTPGNVTYYDVSCSGGGHTVTLSGNLKVSNNLNLNCTSAGTFATSNYSITTKDLTIVSGVILSAGSSIIKVSGNISGTGTFTAGTSTVVLNGTNQTISGTRTYYNLYKLLPDATTDTLTFTAGTTYTIASGGTARFIGTRGYPLSVQSSSAGSAFTLTKTGSIVAEYVSLKDCTVSSATSAVASTNVSGNTNWTFTKEFVSTIRATGGDYTTLSSWEAALGTVDLTAAATKVFSHGGITGSIPDNSSVTGATSGATGTAVHTTSTQMLIKSITGTFQSGEQIRVDVSNYVTSSDTGNGAIAVAEAYNDWPNALNDSVTISGETTDADNFILITVPASQQHGGKLKDTASNYYRGFTLKPSASTAIVLDNQQSYTRIEGVAVDGTNATATNIRLNGTSPFATRLLSAGGVDGISLSGGAIVLNSLARDGTGKCFEDTTGATTNYTVYNSTARGCAYGFHGDNTTTAITLKNVLGSANTTADFALTNTGAKSVTYSASSDATADDFGTTTGDRVSQTFSFIDATNKDFHLAPKDAGARNYGLDLLSDSTYPITKDIDNDVRPTVNPNDSSEVSYDMGMDEADYDTVRSGDGVILKDGVRLR